MNTKDNPPPDFDLQPQWKWPCGKVGYRPEHLFTTLHDRFNTVSTRLQSLEAFHLDVYEAAKQASSQDEFHELLEARQQQRLEELQHAIDGMVSELVAAPKLMPPAMWEACLPWFADRSIESVACMFKPFSETKPTPAAAPTASPGLLLDAKPQQAPPTDDDTKPQQASSTDDDTKPQQAPPTDDDPPNKASNHQPRVPSGRFETTKTPHRHAGDKARHRGGVTKRSSGHAPPSGSVGRDKKKTTRTRAEAAIRTHESGTTGGYGGGGRYNLRSRPELPSGGGTGRNAAQKLGDG
ncbi:hypothetical protein QBC39DRAFT_361955 [Podospora conica]|nr:hypothetical protein QBC39DRAFT_361955 [Schizothecium conicum]